MKLCVARVLANDKVASHYFRMSFSHHDISMNSRPGQFLMASIPQCKDPFLPRPFAVYNVGHDEYVEILYKKVGKGTTLLAGMRKGDALRITGPLGRGFTIHKDLAEVLVVTGGSGIASVHFLMKQCLRQGLMVYLFYGARTEEDLISVSDLQSMGLKVNVATEDGSLGYHGKVSDLFISILESRHPLSPKGAHAFVCGPSSMMAAVAETLKRFGMSGQFSLESPMACGYGVCQGCAVQTTAMNEQNLPSYQRVCTEGPVFFLEEICWDRLE